MNRRAGSIVLMLTTTGRKTGKPRSVLVSHVKDGNDFDVIGSNWGNPRPPAWALNLAANPVATVTIGKRSYQVRAVILTATRSKGAGNSLSTRCSN